MVCRTCYYVSPIRTGDCTPYPVVMWGDHFDAMPTLYRSGIVMNNGRGRKDERGSHFPDPQRMVTTGADNLVVSWQEASRGY